MSYEIEPGLAAVGAIGEEALSAEDDGGGGGQLALLGKHFNQKEGGREAEERLSFACYFRLGGRCYLSY